MITLQFLILVGLTSFLVAYLLTPLVRRLAPALGMLDVPNHRKIHQFPVPRGGGIAIFLGFHLSLVILYYWPLPHLKGYLNGIWWWHFFLLSFWLVLLGVVDDILNLRARTKLAGQTLVAVGAFLSGMHVGGLMGIKLHFIPDLILTVFWFLAIINAFNLIDGMDGLASGLAIIGGLGLAGTLFIEHLNRDLIIVMALVGACLGFLRYNFHPATIFLGDSGSMFLGFALGAIALSTGAKDTAITTLIVPALAVGVPLFDTSLAIWRRIARKFAGVRLSERSGESGIMDADAEHLHHRLLNHGRSHQRVAVILYVAALILVTIGLMSLLWQSSAIGIYTLAFVAGTYVVVRHIAHAELWASTAALLDGLTRPSRKAIMMVIRVPLDLLLAGLTLLITRLVLSQGGLYLDDSYRAFTQFIIWIAIPFLSLTLFRIYDRAWSMATLLDFFMLGVSTVSGVLVAVGLTLLITGLTFMEVLPEAVLYAGLLAAVWIFSRALPNLLQDAVAVLQRWHGLHELGSRKIILVGAGPQCVSILGHESFLPAATRPANSVVGLVDVDPTLLNRYIHGHRVIGLISHLEALIPAYGIHELVITRPLPVEVECEVVRAARVTGVKLYRWQTSFQEVIPVDPAP